MLTIDALAQEIRRVDGNHSLGTGALAEALYPALSALVEEKPVAVRALEWRVFCSRSGNSEAETPFGEYVVQSERDGWMLYLLNQGDATTAHLTLDEAKAAAQADFEQRIRSALVDVPAVESEPVAWLRVAKMTPITGDEYQSLWLTDEEDPRGFPVYTSPAALSRKGSDAQTVERCRDCDGYNCDDGCAYPEPDAQTVGGGMAAEGEVPEAHVVGDEAEIISAFRAAQSVPQNQVNYDQLGYALSAYAWGGHIDEFARTVTELGGTYSPPPHFRETTHRDPLPSDADDMGDGAGGATGGAE